MTETSRRSFLVKAALGLVVSTALVLFLFRYIDLKNLGEMFSTMSWPWCMAGFGIWLLVYLLRAARFVMVSPKTPYLTMLCISSVHNLFLRLLPMRMGEFTYGLLVKRSGTGGLAESMLNLLLLRLLETATAVLVFIVALLLYQGVFLGSRKAGVLAASLAVLVCLAMVLIMGRLLRLALRATRWITSRLGLGERAMTKKLLEKGVQVVESFSEQSSSRIIGVSVISVVIWLVTFWAFFANMRAFFIPVGMTQTILGATAAVVTSMLPVGGIGIFGTHEAGWALGFTLVGLDSTQAVASGFGVSITTLGYAGVMGLGGWIGLELIRRGEKRKMTARSPQQSS